MNPVHGTGTNSNGSTPVKLWCSTVWVLAFVGSVVLGIYAMSLLGLHPILTLLLLASFWLWQLHRKAERGGPAKVVEEALVRGARLLLPAALGFAITSVLLFVEIGLLFLSSRGGGGSPGAMAEFGGMLGAGVTAVGLANGVLWGVLCRPGRAEPAIPRRHLALSLGIALSLPLVLGLAVVAVHQGPVLARALVVLAPVWASVILVSAIVWTAWRMGSARPERQLPPGAEPPPATDRVGGVFGRSLIRVVLISFALAGIFLVTTRAAMRATAAHPSGGSFIDMSGAGTIVIVLAAQAAISVVAFGVGVAIVFPIGVRHGLGPRRAIGFAALMASLGVVLNLVVDAVVFVTVGLAYGVIGP